MGNFLRRSSAVVLGGDGGRRENVEVGEKNGRLRIKVRMRRAKLEELLYLARRGDQSDGDGGNIGILILKEYMESRLPARVLGADDYVSPQPCGTYLVSRRLSSIKEE